MLLLLLLLVVVVAVVVVVVVVLPNREDKQQTRIFYDLSNPQSSSYWFFITDLWFISDKVISSNWLLY